ncbi:hypothetical protein P3G55_26885, partial [Leptospira sp. 96542]|nr:hypothetical protein [Leptospira sp. 96542]
MSEVLDQAGAARAMPPWITRQSLALAARPGHAWLLQGPSGLGQYALALALARAWLCESPVSTAAAATHTGQGGAQGGRTACGQCPSCHAIDVRTHADL